jgi:O-antigen ligase
MTVLLGLANLQLGLVKDLSVVGFAKVTRFEGTQVNPNRMAIFLATALPLGFYAVKQAQRLYLRILYALGSFLLILAIFASFSRGALFPVVYVGIFLLIVLVILITPTYYWARILSLGALVEDQPRDWSIYMRMQAAKSAINLFLQYPLTGVGLNNFYVRSGSDLYVQLVSHNAYLEILSGVGLFGFIAWGCMLLSGLRGCLMGMKHRWDQGTVWLESLSFYLLLSFLSSLLNILFISGEFAYFLWIPLAGCLAAGDMVRRHRDTQ